MRHNLYFIMLSICFLAMAQEKGKQTLGMLNESPAGSKIVWFLKTVINGKELSESDVNNYFSSKLIEKVGWKNLANNIKELSANEGELHLYEADRRDMMTYWLKVKSKNTDEWFKMEFYFEDTQPYKIRGFTIDSTDDQKLDQIIFPNY